MNCRIEFTFPMPSESLLNDFYEDYYDIRAKEHVITANAKKNLDKIFALGLTKTSKVLDFGSGKNAFVIFANSKGCHFLSYEEVYR